MSAQREAQNIARRNLPQGDALERNVASRRRRGTVYRYLLLSSVLVGLLALGTLLYDVIDQAIGLTAWEY